MIKPEKSVLSVSTFKPLNAFINEMCIDPGTMGAQRNSLDPFGRKGMIKLHIRLSSMFKALVLARNSHIMCLISLSFMLWLPWLHQLMLRVYVLGIRVVWLFLFCFISISISITFAMSFFCIERLQ